MMDRQEIFKLLERNVNRVTHSTTTFKPFFEKYVLEELPVRTLLEIRKLTPILVVPTTLDNDEAFVQAVKVLALLEVCSSLQEFEALIMRRKKKIISESPKQELTDFDKILSAMMKVPKPKSNSGTKKAKKKGD